MFLVKLYKWWIFWTDVGICPYSLYHIIVGDDAYIVPLIYLHSVITDIKQIDQADAAFTKITVGTLAEGTYEIRLGGDGDVRWGTLVVKEPEDDSPYENPNILIGDVNNAGGITITDVIEVAKHTAQAITLTGDALQAADANDNGEVTITDVIEIAKYTAQDASSVVNGTSKLSDKKNLVK